VARRVFFSFHYTRDIWRVGQIKNSWVGRERESSGFWNAAEWESIKRDGDAAVKRWINANFDRTSVTGVLIGAETYSRRWVRYEIVKSLERGNGLLGIYIHNCGDQQGYRDSQGPNPFEYLRFEVGSGSYSQTVYISEWNGRAWQSFSDIPTIPLSSVRGQIGIISSGQLSMLFPTYDWVYNSGYDNIGAWVEAATVGR
jgi:hypothetical protein